MASSLQVAIRWELHYHFHITPLDLDMESLNAVFRVLIHILSIDSSSVHVTNWCTEVCVEDYCSLLHPDVVVWTMSISIPLLMREHILWSGICEKQGPSVSPILQACTTRLVSSAGQVQMSSQEQKKGLRSLFLSSFKLCQPLMAFQAASMSTVMAAYAAGGSAGNSAVLDDGGAGLTSFVWSDPKVNNQREHVKHLKKNECHLR